MSPGVNHSNENEFDLHENEHAINSFSYERLCTRTCFETKAKGPGGGASI